MSRRYLAKSLSSGLCHQQGDIVDPSNGARLDGEQTYIRTLCLLYMHSGLRACHQNGGKWLAFKFRRRFHAHSRLM